MGLSATPAPALRDNVNQLFNAGHLHCGQRRPGGTVSAVSAAGSILLRSVRVPGSDGTVATFMAQPSSGGLQMEHLTGLLPSVRWRWELVAEGHANKRGR